MHVKEQEDGGEGDEKVESDAETLRSSVKAVLSQTCAGVHD